MKIPTKIKLTHILFSLAIFAACFFSIGGDASGQEPGYSSPYRKRILILDFDDSKITPPPSAININPGKLAADLLRIEVIKSNYFLLIEKTKLDAVLKEQGISNIDIHDIKSIKKIGLMMGAHYVLLGEITNFQLKEEELPHLGAMIPAQKIDVTAEVDLTLKTLDLSNDEIVEARADHASTTRFPTTQISGANSQNILEEIRGLYSEAIRESVREAFIRLAFRRNSNPLSHAHIPSAMPAPPSALFNSTELRPFGRISSVTGNSVTIGLGEIENVKPGQIFTVFHPREFKDTSVAQVRIDSVDRGFATGIYVSGDTDALRVGAVARYSNRFFSSAFGVSTPISISRYPNIETQDEVLAENEFAVTVSLSKDKANDTVQLKSTAENVGIGRNGILNMSLPAADKWEIEVILGAPGFSFKGNKNIEKITITGDQDSTDATFYLTALPLKENEVERKTFLFATYRFQNAFLAKVEKPITIRKKSAASTPVINVRQSPEPVIKVPGSNLVSSNGVITRAKGGSAVGSPPLLPPSSVPPPPAPAPPPSVPSSASDSGVRSERMSGDRIGADLTIIIWDNMFPGQPDNSLIQIWSSDTQLPDTENFSSDTAATSKWLAEKYREFSALGNRGTKPAISGPDELLKERLRGFGIELYNRQPEALKRKLWELHDKYGSKLKSIQIISNNPQIPYELIYPVRENKDFPKGSPGNKSLENGFLGLEYNVARLYTQNGTGYSNNQPQKVFLNGISVIAPQYAAKDHLQAVAEEVNEIKNLNMFSSGEGFKQVPGKIDELKKFFASLPSHMIHFAGHGAVRKNEAGGMDTSLIALEDGNMDSLAFQGITFARTSEGGPIFFFNACEIGQAEQVAGYVDGWADKTLKAGASAYIGALWSVGDKSAAKFASTFYSVITEKLKINKRVAVSDVLRQVRQEYIKNNDPSFLSYVFYGDPNLVLESK